MDGENEFIPLSPDRVKEIVNMNSQKKKPHSLKDFMIQETVVAEIAYENVVGQDSLSRFDDNFGKKKKNKPTRNPNQQPRQGEATAGRQNNPNQNRPQRVEKESNSIEVSNETSSVDSAQNGENALKNRNNNNKRRNNNRRNFDKNRNQNRPDSNNTTNE
jgi:hypothetical protein